MSQALYICRSGVPSNDDLDRLSDMNKDLVKGISWISGFDPKSPAVLSKIRECNPDLVFFEDDVPEDVRDQVRTVLDDLVPNNERVCITIFPSLSR